MPKQLNAYNDVLEMLDDDEIIEAIVFGPWGGGVAPDPGEDWSLGYREPNPPPVPFGKRGVILTPEEARPFMDGWSFSGGYGSATCYSVRIWTNRRVLWVTQYDGATGLDSSPRNPEAFMPDMPGG